MTHSHHKSNVHLGEDWASWYETFYFWAYLYQIRLTEICGLSATTSIEKLEEFIIIIGQVQHAFRCFVSN